jgi:hypothetical protein
MVHPNYQIWLDANYQKESKKAIWLVILAETSFILMDFYILKEAYRLATYSRIVFITACLLILFSNSFRNFPIMSPSMIMLNLTTFCFYPLAIHFQHTSYLPNIMNTVFLIPSVSLLCSYRFKTDYMVISVATFILIFIMNHFYLKTNADFFNLIGCFSFVFAFGLYLQNSFIRSLEKSAALLESIMPKPIAREIIADSLKTTRGYFLSDCTDFTLKSATPDIMPLS